MITWLLPLIMALSPAGDDAYLWYSWQCCGGPGGVPTLWVEMPACPELYQQEEMYEVQLVAEMYDATCVRPQGGRDTCVFRILRGRDWTFTGDVGIIDTSTGRMMFNQFTCSLFPPRRTLCCDMPGGCHGCTQEDVEEDMRGCWSLYVKVFTSCRHLGTLKVYWRETGWIIENIDLD